METLIDIYNNKRKTEMKRIILSTMLLLATFATVVAQDLDSKYATNLLKNGTVAPGIYIAYSRRERNKT